MPTKQKSRKRPVRVVAKDAAPRSEREPVLDELPDPEARKAFERRIDEPAVALQTSTAPPRVTTTALADTALGEAPGMRRAELLSQATLTEGQRAAMPVKLAPGACATFVAQGGLGVIEIDAFLTLADRKAGLRVLAQDVHVGPIAVIGGRGHCFENDSDAEVAAELHVTVRRGAGVVLVRGFRGDG